MNHALYNQLAGYYDRIYSRKNYKQEAEELRELIRQHGLPDGINLLEVACGTGRYLEQFEEDFSCTGIDLSSAMLRVARKRLSKTKLRQADMRTFDLGIEFDVVLCLFSSIANLKSYRELKQAIKNMSKHLKPGGVFILGPWLHPGEFKPGGPRIFTYDSPDLKIARLDVPKQRENKSILDFHWTIAERNKPVRYIPRDHHELVMFSPDQYFESMRLAGLNSRFLKPRAPDANGLYLGTKDNSQNHRKHR